MADAYCRAGKVLGVPVIIVMGVTGSGKSTLGQALAHALHCPFVEGDTLHPAANIAKMTAGQALDDADRIPFLENVAQTIVTRSGPLVISCSVLKRAYRERLRRADPDVLFVHPLLSRAQASGATGTASRPFHAGGTAGTVSLGTLEPPGPDEGAIEIQGSEPLGASGGCHARPARLILCSRTV